MPVRFVVLLPIEQVGSECMKGHQPRLLVFVLLSGWLVAALAPSAEDSTGPLAVYFGDLGAYVSSDRSLLDPRSEFERARSVEGMDFLGITSREAQPRAWSAAASALNEHPRSQFVALWSRRYEAPTAGQAVNLLEPAGGGEAEAAPAGGDLFYRWWLPRQAAVTGGPPIVQFPEPTDPSLDYALANISTHPFRDDAAPYAATIQIADTADRYLEYLNEGFRLAPTADSNRRTPAGDWHRNRRTAVLADRLSRGSLIESIRQRRVYASDDSNLTLRFSINGWPMGSVITMAAGTPLDIRIDFSDADEPGATYWLSLRRDTPGGRVDASSELFGTGYTGDGTVVFAQFTHTAPLEYYLIQVLQRSTRGVDSAWTAPIWLRSTSRP